MRLLLPPLAGAARARRRARARCALSRVRTAANMAALCAPHACQPLVYCSETTSAPHATAVRSHRDCCGPQAVAAGARRDAERQQGATHARRNALTAWRKHVHHARCRRMGAFPEAVALQRTLSAQALGLDAAPATIAAVQGKARAARPSGAPLILAASTLLQLPPRRSSRTVHAIPLTFRPYPWLVARPRRRLPLLRASSRTFAG
jgi:hypothetical protein